MDLCLNSFLLPKLSVHLHKVSQNTYLSSNITLTIWKKKKKNPWYEVMLISNFNKTAFIFFISEHCVTSKKIDAHFWLRQYYVPCLMNLLLGVFVIKKNCGKYIPMVVGLRNAIHWTCNSVWEWESIRFYPLKMSSKTKIQNYSKPTKFKRKMLKVLPI